MKATAITSGMLLLAFLLQLRTTSVDPGVALAERLLGTAEALDLEGPPIFVSGDRAVIFVEWAGFEGPVRAIVRVERDLIQEVVVLHTRERVENRALVPVFLRAFSGQPAQSPVLVEAVTGATISSQALIDALNERLAIWKKFKR